MQLTVLLLQQWSCEHSFLPRELSLEPLPGHFPCILELLLHLGPEQGRLPNRLAQAGKGLTKVKSGAGDPGHLGLLQQRLRLGYGSAQRLQGLPAMGHSMDIKAQHIALPGRAHGVAGATRYP